MRRFPAAVFGPVNLKADRSGASSLFNLAANYSAEKKYTEAEPLDRRTSAPNSRCRPDSWTRRTELCAKAARASMRLVNRADESGGHGKSRKRLENSRPPRLLPEHDEPAEYEQMDTAEQLALG
jgi:hypothetical protein